MLGNKPGLGFVVEEDLVVDDSGARVVPLCDGGKGEIVIDIQAFI